MVELAALYRHRFEPQAQARKQEIWKVLCEDFFQRWIQPQDTVLDLACGYGDFINQIQAGRKIGTDLNPDSPGHLARDVEFHAVPADAMPEIADSSVDVVFTSNFLEHLHNKAEMDRVLAELIRILKPGGRFMVLGPNIRYLADQYWDFYDHHLALSHLSLAEGLTNAGFNVETVIPRFLPYTTKSQLPQHPSLVRLYLRFAFAWPILGKQFFVVAAKA